MDTSLRARREELALQKVVWLGLIQDGYEQGVATDRRSKFRKCLQTLRKISKYLTQKKMKLPNSGARLAKVFISVRRQVISDQVKLF